MHGKGWEGPLATDDRADAVILVRREDDRVPALEVRPRPGEAVRLEGLEVAALELVARGEQHVKGHLCHARNNM